MTGGENDEIPVCPDCSSPHIRRRGSSRDGNSPGGLWWCRECEDNFDEPDYRQREVSAASARPSNGLAAELAKIGEERDGDVV